MVLKPLFEGIYPPTEHFIYINYVLSSRYFLVSALSSQDIAVSTTIKVLQCVVSNRDGRDGQPGIYCSYTMPTPITASHKCWLHIGNLCILPEDPETGILAVIFSFLKQGLNILKRQTNKQNFYAVLKKTGLQAAPGVWPLSNSIFVLAGLLEKRKAVEWQLQLCSSPCESSEPASRALETPRLDW